ncbi:MAG: UxaA family hydrolase, partial [Magnetococcales bacterium]|nr:UxaA family hydrolase [Magnetococcales bacterium]
AIEGILDYGERVEKPGLHLAQGPGNDLESVTGLAASGANLICFSTGRGTITGQAIVPVIKISSTSSLYQSMPFDIDYNAGALLDDPERHLESMGDALFECMLATASGQKTCSELNGQQQFQIWTAGKLSL